MFLSLFLSLSASNPRLPAPELPSVTLGRPGPLCPASDLHEQVCQLVWQHAPGPLSDEAGPGPFQRPGVHTKEEVQGHREAITIQSPPAQWTCVRWSGGAEMKRNSELLHGWNRMRSEESTWGEKENEPASDSHCSPLHCALYCVSFPPIFSRVYLNSLIIYLITTIKERTPEDSKLSDFEANRSESLLLRCPYACPNLPPTKTLSLHREVRLTEYY